MIVWVHKLNFICNIFFYVLLIGNSPCGPDFGLADLTYSAWFAVRFVSTRNVIRCCFLGSDFVLANSSVRAPNVGYWNYKNMHSSRIAVSKGCLIQFRIQNDWLCCPCCALAGQYFNPLPFLFPAFATWPKFSRNYIKPLVDRQGQQMPI